MPGPIPFVPYPALLEGQPQQGALSFFQDPRNVGMLSAASGLLEAGGPSPIPVSLGQALGRGMQAGIGGYNTAINSQYTNALRAAQVSAYQQKARQAQLEADLTNKALAGGLSGGNNPEQLEAVGMRLAAAGHPGGATLIAEAQRLRQAQRDQQTVQGFRSTPGSLGAGVTPNSPQGQALLSNLTGDPSFDQSVLQAQNEALNSNTKLAPQPVAPPYAGIMGSLLNSPYVGDQAKELQRQINTTPGLTSQQVLGQLDRLQQQHVTAASQDTARRENQAFRRDMADQTDRRIREMQAAVSGNLQEQRSFGKESKLAQQYNSLSSDFKKTSPAFSAAADYMAGNNYNSSGDRALVFQYQKMLDPQDRVAVTDLRDMVKLGSLPERFKQYIVALAEGKELPDRIRQDMFNEMQRRFNSSNETQTQLEDEYKQRASRYMLNPDNVVIQYSARRKPTGGNAGANSAGQPRVVDFSKLPRAR